MRAIVMSFRRVALVGAACAALAAAEEAPSRPAPSAVFSASRRFVVKGLPSAEALSLTVACEEAAGRLEELLRQPLPLFHNQPLVISARADAAEPRGRVTRAQGWTDRGLAQQLDLVNVERVDQEDLLEALTGLLVNRYLVERQTARRATPADAPAWLSVGLAQNLYASLRARNARLVLQRWTEEQSLSAAGILALRHLPDGRWSEKAFCGVFTDWLLSFPAAESPWDRLAPALAGPDPVTAPRLAGVLLGREDVRELEKHWELWIARQKQVRRIGEADAVDSLGELEARLVVRPAEWPELEALGLPEILTCSQWIDYRGESWMPSLVRRLEVSLGALGFGLDDELRRVRDLYVAYVSALAPRPVPGLFGWLRASRPNEALLRERLRAAEEALAAYKSVRGDRLRFVDEAEAEFGPPPAAPEEMPRYLPRAELQRYVDEAEGASAP